MRVSRRGALKLCGLAICTLPTFPGAALADGTACKYFSQLPDDCVGAELRKYDNLRNYRYEEIDLFVRRHHAGRQREQLRSDRCGAEQFQPVTRLGCGVQ
jgi:hypothetical protein